MKIRANQTIGSARSYTRAGHESALPCACRPRAKQNVNFPRNRSTVARVQAGPRTRKVLFTSAQSRCCHPAHRACSQTTAAIAFVASTIVVACLATSALADAAQPTKQDRGKQPARRTANAERGAVRVNVEWSGVPLRRAMKRLAESSDVPIFIDRRIDPDQQVSLERQEATPTELVAETATTLGLAVVKLGPVLYIIPPAKAESIKADLARQMAAVRRLKPAQAKGWHRSARLDWPDLAEPRALLIELAGREKISLQGAENVPHDLWPAAELPPLPLVERLLLLLAPFDLTWRIEDEGRGIVIVPQAGDDKAETAK